MPNIEIIGFLEKSYIMADSVRELFEQKPYADDMIITTYANSYALDMINKARQPYFRLVYTPYDDPEEIKKIKELLASLKIDIEVMILHEFIEAKNPKQDK